MQKEFSKIERDFIALIDRTQKFKFDGVEYSVHEFGKPTPAVGECKTDIYLSGKDVKGILKEIKISIKKGNADFLENKMKRERAEQLFGSSYKNIIESCIQKIKHSFESEPLVRINRRGRVEAKTISLGWKFEILNKPGGSKSGSMNLTKAQKIDVYAGTNIEVNKRDSKVNGRCIPNSGVAYYLLEIDEVSGDLNFYLQQLEAIEDFVEGRELYFALKALNYRSVKDKWDGDRPLAVYVDWHVDNNKLLGRLVYDEPLEKKGNQIGHKLQSALRKLNISAENFDKITSHYDGAIH